MLPPRRRRHQPAPRWKRTRTKACDAHGEQVTSEATLEQKVVDDVLGGQDAWKNADQTEGAFAPEGHCMCRERVVRRWWGVGDCA